MEINVTYYLNSLWVLVAAVLVFIMQAGFACCESGFSRSKNACNIWLKNLLDFAIGAIVFYLIGFGIMYGDDWNGLIGINGFFNPFDQNLQIWQTYDGLLSPQVFLLFQTMFCATTATIISGAVAERFKLNIYLIVSVAMTGLIYPVVGHWVWGGGWLYQLGFVDFAGSGVVHGIGGIAACMGAIMVGPRIGKYSAGGTSHAIPGHNIPMAMLGGFLLWIGWYGFNPGSELAFDDTTIYTAITTTLAAGAGGLAGLFTTWIRYKKPDPTLAMNGALAGLVAICTGVAEVSCAGAMIVGVIAGIILPLAVEFFDRKLHIDDPAGAISLHGVSGILGVVLAGFLSTKDGLLYGFGFDRLIAQLIGAAAIIVFVVLATGLLFFILKKTVGIRVDESTELEGLDAHEHGMVAYNEL